MNALRRGHALANEDRLSGAQVSAGEECSGLGPEVFLVPVRTDPLHSHHVTGEGAGWNEKSSGRGHPAAMTVYPLPGQVRMIPYRLSLLPKPLRFGSPVIGRRGDIPFLAVFRSSVPLRQTVFPAEFRYPAAFTRAEVVPCPAAVTEGQAGVFLPPEMVPAAVLIPAFAECPPGEIVTAP